MNDFRFYLSNRHRTFCPQCGRRTFSPYVDSETGEPLDSKKVGKCSRLFNCAYHFTPRALFTEQRISSLKPVPQSDKILEEWRRKAEEKVFEIDGETLAKLQERPIERNHLYRYFTSFGAIERHEETVRDVFRAYRVGTSTMWDGAPVLPLITIDDHCRDAKIMAYNPSTGKRVKEPYPKINWAFSLMKERNANYQPIVRPFFGEHLIAEGSLEGGHMFEQDACLMIFESEKTALFVAIIGMITAGPFFFDGWVPLSTNGAAGLNEYRLSVVKRHVEQGGKAIFFPDNGMFEYWERTVGAFMGEQSRVSVSRLMEQKIIDGAWPVSEGDDVEDYIFRRLMSQQLEVDLTALWRSLFIG